jgi:hypothetical protein
MALITGTPLGNVITPAELYLDQPPTLWIQDLTTSAGATIGLLNNPDANNFYWGLSGTTANPVYEVGCYENFVIADVRTINMVRCDTTGVRAAIQKRDQINITFTLKAFFPLATVAKLMNLGAVTTTAGATEKVGIGLIDNAKYYRAYFASIYDQTTGDYVNATFHRVQFTSAWQWTFVYGQPATVTVQASAFADNNKPSDQYFATIIRADPSSIT